jgi:hypothetical protein
VDEYGYGFRVPGLLVSLMRSRGYVDHTEYDFTSLLKFIEENWGVPPLAERDARANSIAKPVVKESPGPKRIEPRNMVNGIPDLRMCSSAIPLAFITGKAEARSAPAG